MLVTGIFILRPIGLKLFGLYDRMNKVSVLIFAYGLVDQKMHINKLQRRIEFKTDFIYGRVAV